MAGAEVLATYYSFILAILIFLATKYLQTLENVRRIIVENFEHIEKNKQHYNALKSGMRYQIFIGSILVLGIIIDSYLLINVVFPGLVISLGDIFLIILVALSVFLIFAEQIVNISKITDVAYEGNVDEEFDKVTKKK
ncbi:MAG: hypothetical protein JXC85_06200 [Candidatus Aenigmarchaeota archaeon]|nr:hypothetical protein [Candidatus Aenigmarchaeota archaeon]